MAQYSTSDLEICIATMNRENLDFLKATFNQPADEIPYQILIVNQSKKHQLTSDFPNIKVINDVNFGLSRSRNLAIKNSTAKILWFLDDDCKVLPESVSRIIDAHNENQVAIISFMTVASNSGLPFWNYPDDDMLLSRKQTKKILSPEITIKRDAIIKNDVKFNTRFGLGAQFADSENYVFLTDALERGISVFFKKEFIVKHDDLTSSDEVSSNRLIYARGALAVRENIWTAQLKQLKYVFFLWRKGYVKNWSALLEKYRVFNHGMNDYLSGFEGHRNGHPDL